MRRLTTPLALMASLCALGLGATSAAAAPTIPLTKVSQVKTDSATLEADVNPQGKATLYHFEYGPADCSANPCTNVPSPEDGELPAGSADVRVSAQIEGLSPGTTYHFRVVAQNFGVGGGKTESPDRTFTTHSLAQDFDPCPNDSLRKGAGARLPDCRAYEQASPVDKNGNDILNYWPFIAASTKGDSALFLSDIGVPGGEGAQDLPLYLASRDAGGWSTQGLLPPATAGQGGRVIGWLPDLSYVFDQATKLGTPEIATFLSRSSADGSLATIVPYTTAPGRDPYEYAGASADGSVAIFEAKVQLPGTNAIAGKSNLYVWDRASGKLGLAGVMNDEAPPAKGAFAGSYEWTAGTSETTLNEGGAQREYYTQDLHAISADGSAVYFTAAETGQLYLRRNPTEEQSPLDVNGKCIDPAKACTINVSASQKDDGKGLKGTDGAGTRPAAFQAATPDGSVVFFTSSEKLTNKANTGPEPEGSPAIARAEIGGTPASVDLNFLPTRATALALDDTYIYWADPDKEAIGRATLEGDEVKEEFIAGVKTKTIAVNDKYVYWTDIGDGEDGNGRIGRANLDGTDVKPSFIVGATRPWGIAANATHVYWADHESSGSGNGPIMRADIDGNGVEEFTSEQFDPPFYLGLTDTHLYQNRMWGNKFAEGKDNPDNPHPLTGDLIQGRRLDDPENAKSFAVVNSTNSPNGPYKGIAVDDSYVYIAWPKKDTIARSKLDAPHGPVEEPEFIKGAGSPQGVAVNGSHVYWSANQEVLPNPGNDLYRYDADTGELTDLTPHDAAVNGAEVRGVLGASEDGSQVYFAANGVLTNEPNVQDETAIPGNCTGTVADENGQCNLYLWDEGEISFIARLNAGGGARADAINWSTKPFYAGSNLPKASRVSADGATLLFSSNRQLTDYDNEGVGQLYRYDANEESLLCVSCNPSGEAPTSQFAPTFGSISPAAFLPDTPAATLPSILSADGDRVFFETTDALVGADTNWEFMGVDILTKKIAHCPRRGLDANIFPTCRDVYEWEANGTGSCEKPEGCLYLLSTGTEKEASFFAGASASGDDVFIYTRDQLVGQDTDLQRDLYDVRVGGGLGSQYPPPLEPCEGEACKPGVSSPPQSQTPGTATFSGPGNPRAKKPKPRCPKGKRQVRRRGKVRCLAKRQKRAVKRHQRRASNDRGANR